MAETPYIYSARFSIHQLLITGSRTEINQEEPRICICDHTLPNGVTISQLRNSAWHNTTATQRSYNSSNNYPQILSFL
jgi:hypothetical protein